MDTVGSALAKKLRLRPGARAAVVGAPSGYLAALDPPDGVDVIQTLDGPLDWIQVFVRSSAELADIAGPLTAAVARPA